MTGAAATPTTQVNSIDTVLTVHPLTFWPFVFVLLAIVAIFFIVWVIHHNTTIWRLKETIEKKTEDESNEIKEKLDKIADSTLRSFEENEKILRDYLSISELYRARKGE